MITKEEFIQKLNILYQRTKLTKQNAAMVAILEDCNQLIKEGIKTIPITWNDVIKTNKGIELCVTKLKGQAMTTQPVKENEPFYVLIYGIKRHKILPDFWNNMQKNPTIINIKDVAEVNGKVFNIHQQELWKN